MTLLRRAIESAELVLAEAGVESARYDAEYLAAHLAGVERGRLPFLDHPAAEFFDHYREMVTARSRRIPLQHLTGVAAFGPLDLRVGPGVFVPRPETEALLEWACRQNLPAGSRIVDLCTGSGALALALADAYPTAQVVGIDDSPQALEYARLNAEGSSVEIRCADVACPGLLAEYDGAVDLVVANPPYIPDVPEVHAQLAPEVADHDPHHALFGGPDGMALIRPIANLAARWLRPGCWFAVEHDDTTAGETVAAIARTRMFTDIVARTDLAGRPRFVTARKTGQGGLDG